MNNKPSIQEQSVDPALDLMTEFAKATHGTTRHIRQMRESAIFADGTISACHKALAAALWSISARCEPCIAYYVQQATTRGASEAEVGEMLAVASTMGGCVGEMWALKAWKTYKDFASGHAAPDEAPHCCT